MYVDSGSGSMIISAVVAGAAGAGVVAKMGMRRITGAFKKDKGAPEITAPTTDTERQ
ncbi:MAG TPA: hypothetical protein VNQ77_16855 [Frankiaceae bacterium]|nr:hypothetical protein [Frankiaceae bacterium]